jgi:plastocyanin
MKNIRRTIILCGMAATAALSQQTSGPTATVSAHSPELFVRILPDRLEPQQVTLKPGPVVIVVQNRSTAPNVTLVLDQTGGGRLNSSSLQPSQHHALQSYVLTPGTYVLSETHHPSWTCTITVKPGN